MRWFRKYSKRILIWMCAILAVAFLFPSFAGMRQRNQMNELVGYGLDEKGQPVKIKQNDLRRADAEIKLLQLLDIETMSQAGFLSQVRELGGIHPLVSLTCHAVVFGEGQFNRMLRAELLQRAQASGWATDEASFREVVDEINAVTGASSGYAPRYYLLLVREARRAGFGGTQAQVEALLKARALVSQSRYGRPVTLRELLSQHREVTEADVRQALSNFVGVLQYAQTVTQSAALSEPELEQAVRDAFEIETVAGQFVSFAASSYEDQVPEPTLEDCQAQFAAYKQYIPGQADDDNPHGFGYKLPDRVQLAYLRVDVAALMAAEQAALEALPPLEQEQRVQTYWKDNQARFRQVLNREAVQQQGAAPEYRDPPFDEVAQQAEQLLVQQEARRRAEDILTRAKERLSEPVTGAALQDVAPALSTDELALTTGVTDYLSLEEVLQYEDFGQTYQWRGDQPTRRMAEMMFNCQPLAENQPRLSEYEALEVGALVGPLISVGSGGSPSSAYLVALLGADPVREPVSLADDGRAGSTPGTQPVESSQTYEQVRRDLVQLRAYELAHAAAEEFAAEAATDWEAALAVVNERREADPCKPLSPLWSNSLETLRTQVDQLAQAAQNNPQMAGQFQRALSRQVERLRRAMEAAQERLVEGAAGVAVLPNPRGFSYDVFKSLEVTPPTEAEYRQRRPYMAVQLLQQKQGQFALKHFSPANIELRMRYRSVVPTGTGPEEETPEAEQG